MRQICYSSNIYINETSFLDKLLFGKNTIATKSCIVHKKGNFHIFVVLHRQKYFVRFASKAMSNYRRQSSLRDLFESDFSVHPNAPFSEIINSKFSPFCAQTCANSQPKPEEAPVISVYFILLSIGIFVGICDIRRKRTRITSIVEICLKHYNM